MNSSINPFGIRVGQIWVDCDRRRAKRRLQVEGIAGIVPGPRPYALCRVLTSGVRKVTRIALNRFQPKFGYRREELPPPAPKREVSWEEENDRRLALAHVTENHILREAMDRIIAAPRSARKVAYRALQDCKAARMKPMTPLFSEQE